MKFLIADDHTLVREGVKMLINEAYPFAEITDVADSIQLMKMVLEQDWDMIVSDITMPGGESGIDTIKKIKEHSPRTPVIILSMHSAKEYAVRAIKAGASGYLPKDSAIKELITAINQVLAGKKYLSAEVADILAETMGTNPNSRTIDQLSNRELEVFRKLAMGAAVTDIAKEMTLSKNTISTFRSKIFEKMDFQNNMELIRYAVDNKLV
jgi:two-component system invasion response regulator UvrY